MRCDTADTSLVSAACSAASASSRALICKPFACRASLPAQLAQRASIATRTCSQLRPENCVRPNPRMGGQKGICQIRTKARSVQRGQWGARTRGTRARADQRCGVGARSPFGRRGDLASLFLVAPLGGVDSPGGARYFAAAGEFRCRCRVSIFRAATEGGSCRRDAGSHALLESQLRDIES